MAVPLVQLTRAAPTSGASAGASLPPSPVRKPGWLKVKAPGGAELRAAQGHDARARPPHGLRGSALPQRRRVLGAQGRHLHDPGRRLHPELRLLRGRPRHAQGVRPARAGPPGRGGRADGAAARGHHLGGPRRPAQRRRRGLRRLRHRDPARGCPRPRSRCWSPTSRAPSARSAIVLEARPDILNHNLETVERLYRLARPGRPLRPGAGALARARRMAPDGLTKTGIILGMGEEWDEVLVCMRDLRRSDVDILTLGQYLRPSDGHLPVARYYTPEEFAELRDIGMAMGFTHVEASPLVRSSYHAWEQVARPAPRSGRADGRPADRSAPGRAKRPRSGPRRRSTARWLRQMLLIRRFEEKARRGLRLGKIGGFCHLYIGQEAVAVGQPRRAAARRLHHRSYREHGQALARGISAARGHGRAVRQGDGLLAGQGRLDAPLRRLARLPRRARHRRRPHSARHRRGVRHQVPRRRSGRVCFFGEAAVNTGAFHEALNMAALWKLPVVYIFENNRYGMGTALERASAIYDISERACGYDMANEVVDGQDVLAVHAAMERAVERARERQAARRCSRSAPTASWATRCPTRSTATTAPRKSSRSQRSATRSRSGRSGCVADGLMDDGAVKALDEEVMAGGAGRLPVRRRGAGSASRSELYDGRVRDDERHGR